MIKVLTYTNVINKVAEVRLYTHIGSLKDDQGNIQQGISGSDFANELNYLNEMADTIGIDSILVKINSIGGSVFEGYAIISSILQSKLPVTCLINGIAASIAACIAVAADKVQIMDFGTLMIHDPSQMGDKSANTENDPMLAQIKASLVKIISGKGKQDPADVAMMMKKETWMNAIQAKRKGFVDEIVSSSRISKTGDSAKITKMGDTKNLWDLVKVYNSIINEEVQTEEKPKSMKKIALIYNLVADASEDAIALEAQKTVNALKDAQAKILELEGENKTLTTKVETVENKAKEDLKNKAVALVKKGIENKKIKPENEQKMVDLAIVDFASVEELIGFAPAVKKAENIAGKIEKTDNVVAEKGREDWTIRDWEKKAPVDLLKIKNEQPEVYKEMYDAFYTKVRTENDSKRK